MTEEQIKEGNILIVEFLEWEFLLENIVKNPYDDNIPLTLFTGSDGITSRFDWDWNWLLYCWDTIHRRILIPLSKDNKRLRPEINEMTNDMKGYLKWVRIEESFLHCIKIIKWYNSLLETK